MITNKILKLCARLITKLCLESKDSLLRLYKIINKITTKNKVYNYVELKKYN